MAASVLILLYQRIVFLIRTFISLRKNGKGLLIVVQVLESESDSSTGKFETKAQILGMRLAFARLMPSLYYTISRSPLLIRTFLSLRKKWRRTLYSSKRKSSRKPATFTRKNQDLGSIFRNETPKVAASVLYYYIKESFVI